MICGDHHGQQVMSEHSDDPKRTDRTPGPTGPSKDSVATVKTLSPAAARALAEAQARRAEIDRKTSERPKESPAREGPDPVRYGDWEKKGIASDF
jgi:hypothetical protein